MRPHRHSMLLVLALLVALIGVSQLAGPRPGAAQEPTPVPEPSPTPLRWVDAPLSGGPIAALSVAPDMREDAPDVQRIWAAGRRVYVDTRGEGFERTRRQVEGARGIIAASAEVAFATDDEGDLFRTVNGGRSWSPQRLSDAGFVELAAVVPDYETEKQVYAISRQDGRLWRTADGGSRWSQVVLDREQALEAGAVGFSPLFTRDETLFAGAEDGVHWSQDGGVSWTRLTGPDAGPTFGPSMGQLAHQGITVATEFGDDPRRKVDPDVRALVAWNPDGLWRSDDAGASWQPVAVPSGLETVHDVAISPGWPEDPVIAIAGRGEASGAFLLGAISMDGGARWRSIQGDDGAHGTSIALAQDFWHIRGPDREPPRRDPSLTEFIYLPGVYRNITFGDPDAEPPVLSEVELAEPIVINREIYLATHGAGVWRSIDLGASWIQETASLDNVQPTDLVFTGPEQIVAGSKVSGLFQSRDHGHSWQRMDDTLPRGADTEILRLVVAPGEEQARTVFAATVEGLWVSRDGGATWTRTSGPAGARALAISPDFGTDRTLIADGMISTDGGDSWEALPGAEEWLWDAAAFSPRFADDHTLWAGGRLADDPETGSGLRVSTDAGQTWRAIDDRNLRERQILSLAAVAVDPAEPVRMIVGTHRGMVGSVDAGETFERVSRVSSRQTTSLASRVLQEPFVTGVFIAATHDGAYWSFNRGREFLREPRSEDPLHHIALSPSARWTAASRELAISYLELGALLSDGP